MKSLKTYYSNALKNNFCLGAYNFVNFETLKGLFEGCKNTNAPALACVSEGALSYMGENATVALFRALKKEYNLPIFLHLDHGKTFEICKKAIDLGFDSVMIDGSALHYQDNIKLTKKVVNYAHKKGVLVEAELGVLAGIEDTVSAEKNIFTQPAQALDFVSKTQCDTLAIAIGTSHGAYKFKGKQELRFDILKSIQELLPQTPLVLHGASSVPEQYLQTINSFGGTIEGAQGVPEKLLAKCSQKFNICKINTDTDIRLAYFATIRKNLTDDTKNFDLRKPNKLAISEIATLVAHKNTKIFGCKNKI